MRTTRAIALAPYTSEYPCFASQRRAASSTSNVIRRGWSRSATSTRRRDTTERIDSRDSLLNTSIESSLFSSSGGKYSLVRSNTSVFASGETIPVLRSQAVGWARISLPR